PAASSVWLVPAVSAKSVVAVPAVAVRIVVEIPESQTVAISQPVVVRGVVGVVAIVRNHVNRRSWRCSAVHAVTSDGAAVARAGLGGQAAALRVSLELPTWTGRRTRRGSWPRTFRGRGGPWTSPGQPRAVPPRCCRRRCGHSRQSRALHRQSVARPGGSGCP